MPHFSLFAQRSQFRFAGNQSKKFHVSFGKKEIKLKETIKKRIC